jgi:membrane fusion protein, multidrug efflux system
MSPNNVNIAADGCGFGNDICAVIQVRMTTMDDQRGQVLTPPGRARVNEHARRPADARGTVSERPRRRSRLRPFLWLLVIVAIIGGAVWYFPRPEPQPKDGRPPAGAPVPVGVAPVEKGDMPVTLSQLGTVTPLVMVTVKTQISGYLMQVAFQEGQMVNKGDFLAQIDPRPYQVALEQIEAQLAKDQALLKNARLDLQRYNTLVAQNSIAKQTRDTQVSLVAQYEATVQADQAQIDAQKLNLTYCRIVSPVTGRVGLRQVDPGNYVQTSDTNGIVVVTQLQPISVIFTLPEDNLPEVMKRLRAGAVLAVNAYDRTGATELARGKLDTVDNQIDTTTGTVKLRAIFDNDQDSLFPNQFVNIKLLVDTLHYADIVPDSAIRRGAPGIFVYVVKPDHTVAVKKVKLGPTDGQRVAILSGLQPGENVVIDGNDRLRDGAKVTVASAGGSHHQANQPQAVAEHSAPPHTKTESLAAAPQQSVQPAAEACLTVAAARLQPTSPNDQPEPTPAPVPGSVPSRQMCTSPAVLATITEPLEQPTPPKQVLTLPQSRLFTAEIEGLVKRGDHFMSASDITSARLFYERAVEAGDGRAALRMGITFDPVFLDQAGIRVTVGNQREAFFWYQRARDLGQTAAESRLKEFDKQQ